MKKITNNLLIIVLLATMILPTLMFLAEFGTAQSPEVRLRVGEVGTTSGPALTDNWDPAYIDQGTLGYIYTYNCLENLYQLPEDWDGEVSGLIPVLATNWTYEYWPDEMNNHPAGPFENSGGVKSITFSLREGVKFQDGSDWNATVAKWNLDRIMINSGNLTGDPDSLEAGGFAGILWLEVDAKEDFFTPSWNVSWAKNWAASYESFGTTWTNPYPSESMVGRYPIINRTEIVADQLSGGTLKIVYNDWNPFAYTHLKLFYFMSMMTYADYFTKTIVHFGDDPSYGPDFPHLIGTGPYKFQYHDEAGTPPGGLMIRNDEWWNASAMIANGFFDVSHVDVVSFPLGQAGIDSRNTAMVTGQLDYATDTAAAPLEYNDMISSPSITYKERGIQSSVNRIVLNSINETYLKTAFDMGIFDPGGALGVFGVTAVNGLPKSIRKALCYTFDYDKYLTIATENREVRSGLMTPDHIYNDPSIPIPYRNLTIARQTLIDSGIYDMKGLTMSNLTAEWRFVAENDPIHVLGFYWDTGYGDIKNIFEDSLKDIGFQVNPDSTYQLAPSVFEYFTSHLNIVFDGEASTISMTAHKTDDIWGIMWWNYYHHGDWSFNLGYNLGFDYNASISYLIDKASVSNATVRGECLREISRWAQSEQYAHIFISAKKTGTALNKDFDAVWPLRLTSMAYVSYNPVITPPFIPGYELFYIVSVLLGFMGIIYLAERKKIIK